MNPAHIRALTDEYGRGTPGRKVEFLVGSRWAYRAQAGEDLVEVEVIRLGVKKPARLLVRWIADEFEGHQDWVPPTRLKVPWGQVEYLREWEQRWASVQAPAWETPQVVREAIDYVVETLIDEDIADMGYNAQGGVIKIHKIEHLSDLLGLDLENLRGDPLSFEENGALIAPIAIALEVAKRAAALRPEKLLAEIEEEEFRARHEAVHGGAFRLRGMPDDWIPGEVCERIDKERAPLRLLIREWCGAEIVTIRTEIHELREEALRMRAIATKAIAELRSLGIRKRAADLEKEMLEGGS